MNPISAICNVYNEGEYLNDSFEHLSKHVDEFVVIDQGSTDNTVEIAREWTDKVYLFPRVYYGYAYIHQAALMARHEWVLKCDPDERWDDAALRMLPALMARKPDIVRFHVEYGGDALSFGARLWQKSRVLWTDSFDSGPIQEGVSILDAEDGLITNLRTRESAPERYRIEGARRLLARYGDTEVEPYKHFCEYYRQIISGEVA